MEQELEHDYAPESDDIDAPGSPETHDSDTDDADVSDAYREFLADTRTIRYEDSADNKRKLYDFLQEFTPPLPKTPAALFLAYDELCKNNELELMPLARERAADERTAGEVKAEEAKRAKYEPAQTVAKDAKAVSKMFRRRQNELVRYKNGRRIGAQQS